MRQAARAMRRLGAALALALAAGATAPAELSDYAGVYVATWPLIDSRRALPDAVYALRAIDGVYVRLVWSTIEPLPKAYEWATLDHELDRAVPSGKKISLSVIAGGHAPGWLSEAGASMSGFVVGQGGKNRRCRAIRVGRPWDATYQDAYIRLMTALAAHLRQKPGAYEALRIVKITGIAQMTEELRLPAADGARPDVCRQSNAIQAWQSAGYRPSLVVQGWARMAEGVAAAFPDKLLAQDILERNDFPPIAEDGTVGNRPTVKADILRAGLMRLPGRFAVQWDGLTATGRLPAIIEEMRRAGAIVGWQSNAFRGFEGAGCNALRSAPPRACDAQGYRAILERGFRAGGRYLEIWSPDAQSFPDAIAAARGQ